MARKSNVQIAAESAIRNLNDIHAMELDNRADGQPAGATYRRNASDCSRWCDAIRRANMAYPQFMHDGNIKYFATMWYLPDVR